MLASLARHKSSECAKSCARRLVERGMCQSSSVDLAVAAIMLPRQKVCKVLETRAEGYRA